LFREILESVIQDTATALRIDFVSVANIHNRIPCLAEGSIAAARPHRSILDSGDSRRIFVPQKETICTLSIPVKSALSDVMSIRHRQPVNGSVGRTNAEVRRAGVAYHGHPVPVLGFDVMSRRFIAKEALKGGCRQSSGRRTVAPLVCVSESTPGRIAANARFSCSI
jgi:hypothetical protein